MVYNRVASYVNKQPTPCPVKLGMIELRNTISTNDDKWPAFTNNNPRYADAHTDLRQAAFRELATSIKSAKQYGFPRKRKILFKYKRKKDNVESTSVSARCANAKKGFYSVIFGLDKNGEPNMLNEINKRRIRHTKHTGIAMPPSRLTYTSEVDIIHNKALNQYFFCIPVDIQSASTPDIQGRVCAIDPGIRTMATVYDVSGRHGCTFWGCNHSFLRFVWISRKIARIQSHVKSPDTRHGSRRNMRKLIARLRFRLRCLADEMHHLFAHWLCRNFETILLPEFQTQRMVRRGARVLSKKSVKVLSSWSHYRFKEFLRHKAREYSTNVIICDEYWTSKTCGNCGSIDSTLQGAKKYICKKCDYKADRDANAARNIYLRYIAMNPELCQTSGVFTNEGRVPASHLEA